MVHNDRERGVRKKREKFTYSSKYKREGENKSLNPQYSFEKKESQEGEIIEEQKPLIREGNGGLLKEKIEDSSPTTKIEDGQKEEERKKVAVKVISVKVEPVNLISDYIVPEGVVVKCGDRVAVETDRGLQIGIVLSDPVVKEIIEGELKPIQENLTPRYEILVEEIKRKEEEAFRLCERLAQEKGLPIKLINVDYTVDGTKVIFYFFSEGRVDFRELVKELARQLKVRIEMRQIGIRDVTKMMGGIGPCGREICCYKFLRYFNTVTIKMVKKQNLVLNPQKVSGLCGRLMCCLSYEHHIYEEMLKDLPGVGKKVVTPMGEGEIKEVNIFKKKLKVELQKNMPPVEFDIEQVKVIDGYGEEIMPEEELLKELE